MKNIYLLDTCVISEVTKPEPDASLITNLEFHHGTCAISSITWFELLKGVGILPEGKHKNDLMLFLLDYVQPSFEIIPYDTSAANINADIVSKLLAMGKPTPILDTQIASIAIANNMILVTQNTKDFEIFAENCSLMMENWSES